MNSHLYGELIYNKGGKNIEWGQDSLFKNDVGETSWSSGKKYNLNTVQKYSLTLSPRYNSDGSKSYKTMKF